MQARYLLPAVLPWTAFLPLGVAAAPRWLRAVAAADLALLAAAVTAVFWFRQSPHMFGPLS